MFSLEFITFIVVGLVCGFIDSSLGMGYGISSTTLLISFSITPWVASASVHTVEACVDIVSGASHFKLGNVRKDILLPLLIPGVAGAILGAIGLASMPTNIAKPIVSSILLCMGCTVLYKHLFKWKKNTTPRRKYSTKFLGLLGFAAAFIDVSGGGGWGPICTPTFIMNGSSPRESVGTVKFTEPVISLVAVLTFGLIKGFEIFLWQYFVPLLIGGLLLSPIAAYVCKRTPSRVLGILVGLWVVVLSVRIVLMVII